MRLIVLWFLLFSFLHIVPVPAPEIMPAANIAERTYIMVKVRVSKHRLHALELNRSHEFQIHL
jgi:hypothetical protein